MKAIYNNVEEFMAAELRVMRRYEWLPKYRINAIKYGRIKR